MIRSGDRSRIAAAGPAGAARLLGRMHADDAANLLAEMGEERRAQVGEWLPEPQGRRIRVLLGSEPPSAGALMSRRYVALREDATVADALARVRNRGADPESMAVVFVRDEHGRLRNSIPVERLVDVPPATRLAPVVDARDRVVGVITADDVLELWLRR
jgi:Mg/Co/Ni transporter MgtE